MELELLLKQADETRGNGDMESAAGQYERILAAHPSTTQAAAGLGICLQKLGRPSLALPYLAKVATQGYPDPNVFASLGNCYFKLGKMESAETAFRRAVSLEPGSPLPQVLLAHALVKLGRAAEAEHFLRSAIELDPRRASAFDLMAFLLPQVGRFEEARQYARTAAALEPNNAAYCVRFVFAGKMTEEDREFVDRLMSAAAGDTLKGPERIRIEYGLGKALEDLRDYEGSIHHYQRANDLSLREQNLGGNRFNPSTHKLEIDLLINTFSDQSLRERSRSGSDSELPVFIVGMMRSGTTLTEQILSSHPDIAGAGELSYWVQAGPKLFDANAAQIRATGDDYVKLLAKLGPGKKRVCDKMPQNYMSLGSIVSALPRAKIIHCRRDPRDTCLSLYTIPFTHHPPFAYSLKNIAFTYKQYQRLMEHWRTTLPPDRFLDVDYEQLVSNQESVSRKMIAFLGLEWDASCLRPEQNERVVNTPSRWQVRQPVYGTSVSRWKRFSPWIEQVEGWSYTLDL